MKWPARGDMMKLYRNLDDKLLGKMIILNAIKMEESLAEILKMEVKAIKKQIREDSNSDFENIHKSNKVIKYVLYSMTILDDRIQAGMELLKSKPYGPKP
jgi:hypothetical protein